MNFDAANLTLLGPALIAGLLITFALVPLGIQVIGRGIVFIDLAIAQIAGLGVIVADALGWEPQGWAMQAAALSAALFAALLLTWTERRWPEVQEAIIGATFVLASSAAVLLLAHNPHGGEHLKDLLIGQILWINPGRLPVDALIYATIALLWFTLSERSGGSASMCSLPARSPFRCSSLACTWSSRPWWCRRLPPFTCSTGACQKPMRSG